MMIKCVAVLCFIYKYCKRGYNFLLVIAGLENSTSVVCRKLNKNDMPQKYTP